MPDEETPPEETSEALPPEQEERIVDKVVTRVKKTFEELVGRAPEEVPEEVPEEIPDEEVIETPRAQESSMEAEVRAALAKIKADEKHAEDHERLTKEVERAPRQLGKATQFLWGDRD
jgi:hypothetical protein